MRLLKIWKSSFLIAFLLLISSFLRAESNNFSNSTYILQARNSSLSKIDPNSEYSSGSIQLSPSMNVWYTWINSSSTQVVFLTYYSEVYNSPIMTFLGQHYIVENETEVFIGNTLLLMEVYHDTDGNDIPEADFSTGTEEIEYFFLVNSSREFVPTPVQKKMINNNPHYKWGIEYGGVDGALLFPKDKVINGSQTNLAARVNTTNLSFTYEYYVQRNISYLKTGFEIGRIVDFEPHTPDVSLDGLGLSLLYGTTMLTARPYKILVNGASYDSKMVEISSISTERAEIIVDDTKLYEFVFEENYTIYLDLVTKSYNAASAACSTESIPPNSAPYLSPYWLVGWLLRFLSEDVFPEMVRNLPNLELEYTESSFVYRMCYPTWEGWSLEHDPTYIAYLIPKKTLSPPIRSIDTIVLIEVTVVTLGGIFALTLALIELRTIRRIRRDNLK